MPNEAENKKRYPLNGSEVERLWKKTGLPLRVLAMEAGVAWKSLYNWKNGVTDPEYDNVEKLAEALGVGTEKIILGKLDPLSNLQELVENTVKEERSTPRKGARPEQKKLFGVFAELLKTHSRTLKYYSAFIHFRRWPDGGGFVKAFPHTGQRKNFYAEVTITPAIWPPTVSRERFVFSFTLGPLLIDYGEVNVFPNGDIKILYFFAGDAANEPYAKARVKGEGVFRVWNWFGVDPCKFTVQNRQTDFELTLNDENTGREPTKDREAKNAAGENDVVCFLRTPQHEAAMAGTDDSDE